MSNLPFPVDEETVVTAVGPATEDVTSVGPTCEQCGAPIQGTETLICRRCGWYASIGSYVEIDQQWEAESDPALADEIVVVDEEKFRMPDWAWLMIACTGAVVIESVVARFVTEADSIQRTYWSVTQLTIGMVSVMLSHFIAFILLFREDSDTGLLDVLLKPVRIWALRVRELPAQQWVCHAMATGFIAILMAIAVIGGIPFEKLLDWGTSIPVKRDLVGAIASQAERIEGKDQTLEEAVQDLGGTQNLTDREEGKKKAAASKKSEERRQDDCVIIGFRSNSEGLVYTLVLAGENYGRLQHVGQVTPRLSVKELRALGQQLEQHKRYDPFVHVQMENVTWVDPVIACRVSYARRGKKGGLYETQLEKILGEIEEVTDQPESDQEQP